MIDVKKALRILKRLREAAPPTTAARLTEVITLMRALGEASPQAVGDVPNPLLERGIGHLNELLVQMAAQLDGLRAGRLGQVTTEQADVLALVSSYAASGSALARALSDLERLRTGELHLTLAPFSPLDVAAAVWQRTSPLANSRDHTVTILADSPLPPAYGDVGHISSTLSALVDNAVRYTPFGGEIRLTINALGDHVLFTVADSGIGMSEDDQVHIGEVFWRALHQPLVRAHPGAGVSLALARGVLALMDGELIFSGEPSVGSSFSFTIPVYR
jgi:two-component system sensor histidine kinase ChiS